METKTDTSTDEGEGAGTTVGLVVAIIIIALLFIYGLPALRNGPASSAGTNQSVDLHLLGPGNNSGATGSSTGGSGTGY